MILKLTGSLLVLFSAAAIGFYFSGRMKDRLEELRELKKCLLALKGEIRYAKTPLPEALKNLSEQSAGSFCCFFSRLSGRLFDMEGRPFQSVWRQGVLEDLTETSLTGEDKAYLLRLGESMGYLDQEMQLNTLDLYLEQLETRIARLEEEIREKVRLYNILGIMAGLFITIVMI